MTQPERPPFVLVHGAWGGAWIWRRVLGPLRAAGHEVHAVTLTGDGERAHLRIRLREPGVRLATHVDDVVGLVRAEELDDFVLVGHSYGGAVITAAADRLLDDAASSARAAGRPRTLVYIDAMVPLAGESWSSRHDPELRARRLALAAANDNALPPPDPADFGLQGPDREWLLRRQVPHPFGMYEEPIHFDPARWLALPRWFIDCVSPAYPTIAEPRRRARTQPGWVVREMDTGHCPMVSRPAELVALLLEAAGAPVN
jgi:pimeloyl-ACP methyl ester carboxylesterase